jgi:Domain of unknown function (DUF4157)
VRRTRPAHNLYARNASAPRGLTEREKAALAPYIPEVDLNRAVLHVDRVPRYLPRRYAAIVRGNHIYFRAGVYPGPTREGIALLGHELAHVGQYRMGMTALSYLWSALRGYMNSRYEKAAYALQAKILKELADP